jgi:hypothetical protein
MSDDYMSDEILRLAADIDTNNEKKRRTLRKKSSSSSAAENPPPLSKKRVQELMDEKTAEGMEKAIDSSNKGYQLLQRFGYTEGGLGRHNSGIENPLKITKREMSNR